jgi:hypothetical protein
MRIVLGVFGLVAVVTATVQPIEGAAAQNRKWNLRTRGRACGVPRAGSAAARGF